MKKLIRNPLAIFGMIFIVLILFVSLAGYWIMPDNSNNANEMHLELSCLSPGETVTMLQLPKLEIPDQQSIFSIWWRGKESIVKSIPLNKFTASDSAISYQVRGDSSWYVYHGGDYQVVDRTYYFGADRYGRDMLSRMILGSRVSILVGIVAVLVSMLIGVFLGAMAGYYGGKIDSMISWMINVVWSLPTLLLVIAITFSLGKGFWQVFVAIGLSMWVEVARLVRGQVMSMKEREFVEAARALGFKDFRIIFRHIIPNMWGPLMVMASANFASAILLEAGLSFLGFGAQPPIPTWGGMVKEHYGYIIMDAAFLAFIPGFAIMLLVYSFNVFSNGLSELLDD
jgi:ABC-type dipeptide/oligopeptide/nickel transport system permease subunit